MAQWMEEQEGRGWAGRGVDGGAMGGRGSGRGRRGGEVRPMGAVQVQTDVRDWRRRCRVPRGTLARLS